MGPYFGQNANIWFLIGSVFSLELGPYWVRFLLLGTLKIIGSTASGQKIFGPWEGGKSDQIWPELIAHPCLFISAPIFNPFGLLG